MCCFLFFAGFNYHNCKVTGGVRREERKTRLFVFSIFLAQNIGILNFGKGGEVVRVALDGGVCVLKVFSPQKTTNFLYRRSRIVVGRSV